MPCGNFIHQNKKKISKISCYFQHPEPYFGAGAGEWRGVRELTLQDVKHNSRGNIQPLLTEKALTLNITSECSYNGCAFCTMYLAGGGEAKSLLADFIEFSRHGGVFLMC